MSDQMDGFGYTPETLQTVVGVQVGEAKEADTLVPAVSVWVRVETNERLGFALTPALADSLADELKRWAERARQKHWE